MKNPDSPNVRTPRRALTWPMCVGAERQKEKGVFGARNPKVSTRRPFTPYDIGSTLIKEYCLEGRIVKGVSDASR